MRFENPNLQTKERKLYPERASVDASLKIKKIKELQSGHKKIKLENKEKEQLFEFENDLGENLEKIYDLNIISSTFCLDYFLTTKGKEDFQKTTNIEIKGNTLDEIKNDIFQKRFLLKKINPEDRNALSGRSERFGNLQLKKSILNKIGENGELKEISDIYIPQRTSLLLSSETALKKINSLREFKLKLKKILSQKPNESNLELSKNKIIKIYLRRINEMIMEIFPYIGIVKNMSTQINQTTLSQEEYDLLKTFTGLSDFEKNYSRFDKLTHGTSKEKNSSGEYIQINQEIEKWTNKIESLHKENELNKTNFIKEKGLDPEKIKKANIPLEEFTLYAEKILEHYKQKSDYPNNTYNPDRESTTPDDKWQFIARSEYESMKVVSKQKIIISGDKNKDADETIAILCGHEIEGHLIQNINISELPLRLFKKIKADRSSIFAEAGAMYVQNKISQEAFGYSSIPHPHYIRAMIKKLEGGNYLDCVKAFYESALKTSQDKKNRGLIDENEFKKELGQNLTLAINRTKRLFQLETDLNKKSSILSKSKDTVYLEQTILAEKLKENGLEKYLFLTGINLDVLGDLLEMGLIDTEKIKVPDFYSLQIWDKIKDKYK